MKTLRSTMTTVVLLASATMLVLSVLVISMVYTDGFSAVERENALRDLTRVRNILDGEVHSLASLTRDWAWWDDTYAFMDNRNAAYIESNLTFSTFEEQHLRFVVYLHNDGSVATGRLADLDRGVFLPLPGQLQQALRELWQRGQDYGTEGLSGVLLFDGVAHIVSAMPVLTSMPSGPPRGACVMGRVMDEAFVQRAEAEAGLDLSLYVAGAPDVPDLVRDLADAPGTVRALSPARLMAVAPIADVFGSPSLLVAAKMSRPLHALAGRVVRYHIAGVIAPAMVLVAVVIALMDSLVVSRLSRLGRQVSRITKGPGYSGAVELSGTDEVAVLAHDINGMLEQLRENEHFFSQILSHLHAGVMIVDESSLEVLEVNPFVLELFGLEASEVLGARCVDRLCKAEDTSGCPLVHTEDVGRTKVRQLRRGDGAVVSIVSTAARVTWQGRACILETMVDITALEETQLALQETEKLYRTVFMNTGAATMLIEEDTTILLANPEFETLVGRSAQELEGKVSWVDLFHPEDVPRMLEYHRSRRQDPMDAPRMYEARVIDTEGKAHHVTLTVAMVPGERISVASLVDITERKKAEEQLVQQAFYDELTGLPNRRLLMERLERAIEVAQRRKCSVGVFLLDLDNFKLVNDLLGHQSGDEVLRMVAERLCEVVRSKDTVARLGGDEFLVVVDDAKDGSTLARLATSINDRFARPFHYRNQDFYLGFSIGVSVYPDDGVSSPEELVQNADMAMYQAKRTEQNSFSMFTAEMNQKAMRRLTIEGELRTAVKHRNFVSYYQPQVDLFTGEVIGAEALVRWVQPDGAIVPPNDFIPLAEETGLIVPIDLQVMEDAAERVALWQKEGAKDFKISINLSARHFAGTNLPDEVRTILSRTGLAPGQLGVEITETLLMQNMQQASEILGRLSRMGVRVLLDDFGTGYSSLSYLRRLPIDTLKIDRSFVQDITGENPESEVVPRTILQLAESLGLNVVAEGVETPEQVEFLRRHGCTHAQGFLFSRPVPHTEFRRFFTLKSIFSD
jgi:diguanylate cyclase (GGDEF)-like protein/PAS domain S-box-containing protein